MFKAKRLILIMLAFLVGLSSGCKKKDDSNKIDYEYETDRITNVFLEEEGYTKIGDFQDLEYFYKKSNTVIMIRNKNNNYIWKTGLDDYSRTEATNMCKDAKRNIDETTTAIEILNSCPNYNDKLNTTYTNFANSLITLEYFDDSNQIVRVSSSSSDADIKLLKYKENGFILEFESRARGFSAKVRLRFQISNKGISYEIRDSEIEGENQDLLAGIIINPFLGANGGMEFKYEYELIEGMTELESVLDGDYSKNAYDKPWIDGYSFVPDGSGSLIKFQKNSAELSSYYGKVYGSNQTYNTYNDTNSGIKIKNAGLPVYGIAHEEENAFVAYANRGEEYLNIISYPNGNMTHYNYTYPRFNYNNLYYKVYNKSGNGLLTIYDERLHYDAIINYEFLSDDKANYIGMADVYRNYLISNGTLDEREYSYTDIGLRLDFLMAEAKESIFGFTDTVLTNTLEVDEILNNFINNDIKNINSGLIGFQSGGLTLGKPDTVNYSNKIGSKKEFKDLINKYSDLNVDISLSQNYYQFNSKQKGFMGNASKHVNGYYNYFYEDNSLPIFEFCLAKPEISKKWALNQFAKINKDLNVSSHTITGISDNILSDRNNLLKLDMNKYEGIFKEINSKVLVNADNPNAYLLKYVDRFLNCSPYDSSFLIETETVPFLQYVLKGTMELYAPYANFSFSDTASILKMIDFNLYPSFVLTSKSSENLIDTNASVVYFSTEYNLYKDLVIELYEEINSKLSNVINANWTNRIKLTENVYLNEYDNGISILINYSNNSYIYKGTTVKPQSSEVFK